jgi:predicted transcriptional regulator of viral defense system
MKSGDKKLVTPKQALRVISKRQMVRLRNLAPQGITGNDIQRLVVADKIERVGRGLYRAKDADVTENYSLLQAALLVPKGVVCLLSALRYHELTTQAPVEVWLAIDNKAWKPTVSDVPLRIHYFTGAALTEGVEEHSIEGVPVKIYRAAKTVADCFKFRNKIGIDVALEALREYFNQRLPEKDLWHYAEICRVKNVIYPYMEAIK